MKGSPMVGTRFVIPIILMILPLAGFAGEESGTSPGPPRISLTTTCLNGLTAVTLKNTGGAMTKALLFEAVFADGERDTLFMKAGAQTEVMCPLSNIHGAVTVTNTKYGLTARADDCLMKTLGNLLAYFDLGSFIPSPLGTQDITVCTYTINIKNFKYDAPTFELIRKDHGLVLKYIFRNVRGDVSATGSKWACVELNGNFKVAAVVSETDLMIDEGGSPEVSVGATRTKVQGLDVSVAGSLGFVADWILDFFEETLTREVNRAIEAELNALAGSDLSSLVVVRSGCPVAE